MEKIFNIDETVLEVINEKSESYNVAVTKPQPITFQKIQEAVELVFGITDLGNKTKLRPYPDARKFFVKAAYKRVTLDKDQIMSFINRKRSVFYHNFREANKL